MNAERLIGVSRHALAGSAGALDVIAEAWQAQALAQAIGGHLVLRGPRELRGEARQLVEAGGRGCAVSDPPALGVGGIRAARLAGVPDIGAALAALGALLGEVGIALVAVACGTDEEALYWQCMEAIDAADESNDRVGGMLHRLATREQERERERERDREREWETGVGWEWERSGGLPEGVRGLGGPADSPVV
ncbi:MULTISPECIES: DUF6099 family protein [unclassified Streptomyces]|uniref:DUF6099 family protein n=1 Tax=unclassified Streptomyces TaxID=2593676 RepID=UPI0037F936E7